MGGGGGGERGGRTTLGAALLACLLRPSAPALLFLAGWAAVGTLTMLFFRMAVKSLLWLPSSCVPVAS
jgi:hypothetical protein